MKKSITVSFSTSFARAVKKMQKDMQEEVLEKIDLFKDIENHKQLKVHKLNGEMKSLFSFSVNYKTRIIFQHISKDEVVCLAIGNHNDVY